jgi:hypothetical protein
MSSLRRKPEPGELATVVKCLIPAPAPDIIDPGFAGMTENSFFNLFTSSS